MRPRPPASSDGIAVKLQCEYGGDVQNGASSPGRDLADRDEDVPRRRTDRRQRRPGRPAPRQRVALAAARVAVLADVAVEPDQRRRRAPGCSPSCVR